MSKTLLIFGGKSTALEIAEVASEFYKTDFSLIKFVIGNKEKKNNETQLFDSEVATYAKSSNCNFIISFSNHKLRLKIENWMNELKIKAINIIHPNAIISKSAKIGCGNYIAANAVISSKSTIGNHNIINFNSTVGHDTIMNNHIIINPGARISGNVNIGSRILIGANAFIFQGKTVGDDTLIDALTYIDRDIESKMICSSKQVNVFKRVIF
jgi:sugar O-acyltransferase (sialic acid O-acetyltransferase NeuD family)